MSSKPKTHNREPLTVPTDLYKALKIQISLNETLKQLGDQYTASVNAETNIRSKMAELEAMLETQSAYSKMILGRLEGHRALVARNGNLLMEETAKLIV